MKLVTIAGRRQAIRRPDGTLLAVPPMHPATPRDVRRTIFRHILTGQLGLAWTLADIERDLIEGRDRHARRMARTIANRPHAAEDVELVAPVVEIRLADDGGPAPMAVAA